MARSEVSVRRRARCRVDRVRPAPRPHRAGHRRRRDGARPGHRGGVQQGEHTARRRRGVAIDVSRRGGTATDPRTAPKGGDNDMMLALYTRAQPAWAGLKSRFVDERGVVSTEYGLLLVLIALAIVAAATALGLAIAGVFNKANTKLGGV